MTRTGYAESIIRKKQENLFGLNFLFENGPVLRYMLNLRKPHSGLIILL